MEVVKFLKSIILFLLPVDALQFYSDYLESTNLILLGQGAKIRLRFYCIILLLTYSSCHFVYLNFAPGSWSQVDQMAHADFVHFLFGNKCPPIIFTFIYLYDIYCYVKHFLRPNPHVNWVFTAILFGDLKVLQQLTLLPYLFHKPVRTIAHTIARISVNAALVVLVILRNNG